MTTEEENWRRIEREREERNAAMSKLVQERNTQIRAKLREAVEAIGGVWTASPSGYGVKINGGHVDLRVDAVADRGRKYDGPALKYASGTFQIRLGHEKTWRSRFEELEYGKIAPVMIALGERRKAQAERERRDEAAREAVRADPRVAEIEAQIGHDGSRDRAFHGHIRVGSGGRIELSLHGITLDQAERVARALKDPE